MPELGKINEMHIVELTEHGAYLSDAAETARVLLPKREVLPAAKKGDSLSVFIYRDSEDRLIATMQTPKIKLHEVTYLDVAQVTKIGAFLDWGLAKDLLLPFHEQTRRVKEGEEVLVALYVDKSDRLCATMNVYPYLSTRSPYQIGDEVMGTVYETSENFGVFIAVDGKYSGLIPAREAPKSYRSGEVLTLRVTGVKEDGKLDLSAHKAAYLQMEDDAEAVLSMIRDGYEGCLPFDDKASPEQIREVFGLSKAAFKRAVGRLYKERLIELREGKITIV